MDNIEFRAKVSDHVGYEHRCSTRILIDADKVNCRERHYVIAGSKEIFAAKNATRY